MLLPYKYMGIVETVNEGRVLQLHSRIQGNTIKAQYSR